MLLWVVGSLVTRLWCSGRSDGALHGKGLSLLIALMSMDERRSGACRLSFRLPLLLSFTSFSPLFCYLFQVVTRPRFLPISIIPSSFLAFLQSVKIPS